MVEEVNKIVYNTLASGRNLYLAGIGSLVIERFGAKRRTRKFIEQPRKIIAFTEQQKGVSLEEEIARAGNIDAEKAHDIFEQWLMQVLDGDTLDIEGVGTLRRDKFTMTDAFSEILNRQGRERIAIKTRSNGLLYIFASISCLFALCVAGYVWFENNGHSISIPFIRNTGDISVVPVEEHRTDVLAADTQNDAVINADTLSAGLPSESAGETTAAVETTTEISAATEPSNVEASSNTQTSAETRESPETQKSADTIFESVSGRSYVVLGIYSTPENAFRAVGQAKARISDADCTVYRYGSRYMVSVYNSDNREQAVRYMDSISRTFKDLWVYTKK